MADMTERRCIGFGPNERRCKNVADTPAGLWCQDCEKARREHITEQMAKITAQIRSRS